MGLKLKNLRRMELCAPSLTYLSLGVVVLAMGVGKMPERSLQDKLIDVTGILLFTCFLEVLCRRGYKTIAWAVLGGLFFYLSVKVFFRMCNGPTIEGFFNQNGLLLETTTGPIYQGETMDEDMPPLADIVTNPGMIKQEYCGYNPREMPYAHYHAARPAV